ncbi:MAG: glutamate-1-semialdehyde 2,1-aminomutase [Phycisphaerae bacterium]|nr:glutamate-1-semialdehyde 2,1-aminomutase [Phycisphaerae bacterium]
MQTTQSIDGKHEKSAAAFQRANKVLVGGVNSPVRAFTGVGGNPLLIAKAFDSKIVDLDGNEYIDYVGSYGPAILGHADKGVVMAIHKAILHGTSYGAPTQMESTLAERIVDAVDSIEKVRFTNSGTEAVMTAIRIARGATGRSKIVKFVGGYHGHSDALLVEAGSGATTLGVPSSKGVPEGATADTLLVNYNDTAALAELFAEYPGQIAAVLVEPVAGNMGVVPPADGFLQSLRDQCDSGGALLIFDEVMTGFRLAWGGAQQLFGIRPDITTLGKVIGGGMPVGAVGGREDVMDHLAPVGGVYQAGTLSGNPAAMSAGIATLDEIQSDADFYTRLEEISASLEAGLVKAADRAGVLDKICINRVGSMLCCFFTPGPVTDYQTAKQSNLDAFAKWFHAMLAGEIYLPPSQFEAIFVSITHTPKDVQATCAAAERAFSAAGKFFN